MKYYAIQIGPGARCLVAQEHVISMVQGEILALEPGEWLKINAFDMSEEEYCKFPEFQGW